MIVATTPSFLRQTVELTDPDGSGAPFGGITLRLFTSSGRLTVGDAEFELEARGFPRTATALVCDGATLAVARRPGLFSRRMEVAVSPEALGLDAGVTLELLPSGWLNRRWTVLADGLDMGTATWNGAIRPVLRADLSEALPLVVQAFVVAVLVVQRRREGRNSG